MIGLFVGALLLMIGLAFILYSCATGNKWTHESHRKNRRDRM